MIKSPSDIVALLRRAAAGFETPKDLGPDEQKHLVEDILDAATTIEKLDSGIIPDAELKSLLRQNLQMFKSKEDLDRKITRAVGMRIEVYLIEGSFFEALALLRACNETQAYNARERGIGIFMDFCSKRGLPCPDFRSTPEHAVKAMLSSWAAQSLQQKTQTTPEKKRAKRSGTKD